MSWGIKLTIIEATGYGEVRRIAATYACSQILSVVSNRTERSSNAVIELVNGKQFRVAENAEDILNYLERAHNGN